MYTSHAILKMYCHIKYTAACCLHTSCLAPQADQKIFCIQSQGSGAGTYVGYQELVACRIKLTEIFMKVHGKNFNLIYIQLCIHSTVCIKSHAGFRHKIMQTCIWLYVHILDNHILLNYSSFQWTFMKLSANFNLHMTNSKSPADSLVCTN